MELLIAVTFIYLVITSEQLLLGCEREILSHALGRSLSKDYRNSLKFRVTTVPCPEVAVLGWGTPCPSGDPSACPCCVQRRKLSEVGTRVINENSFCQGCFAISSLFFLVFLPSPSHPPIELEMERWGEDKPESM